MNRFIKVAMLLSIVTVLLTALSFKTAEARTNVSRCQVCQGRFIPQSGGPPFKFLNGVAAVSASDIWAVGISSKGNSSFQTLIEHWNGTQWSIVQSPSPGAVGSSLSGVAAVSTSNVWAVGSFANSFSSNQTLIEHWNGTQWSVVKSPNPSGSTNFALSGIAIISTSDIWAVGGSNNNTSSSTLIEHWNGTQWSIVKSPNPGSLGNSLSGVAAVSTSDVWAVGSSFSNTNNSEKSLIEHWNGAQWNIVKSPSPGSLGNFLVGVTAVSANDIWAVGASYNRTSSPTLIEHWNGTQWSVVKSPNPPGSPGSDLVSVVAVSARDIWAVGNFISPPPLGTGTLIEHWNGSKWSVVTSPNQPGSANNFLGGIAIVSASDIWAVGGSYDSSGIGSTLVEYWNGSKWSIIKSPATENNHHSLN